LEEFYLTKAAGKNAKKSRTDSSASSEKCVEIFSNKTEGNLCYKTFVIENCLTSSAFASPKENNNNIIPQTIVKPRRLKKANSDGTPLTAKLAALNEYQSTGAKPKKLMDITSMHNVEDETLKIPVNLVSSSISKPLKRVETMITIDDFDESIDLEATTVSNYPKWCWNIKKALEADRYGFKAGETEANDAMEIVHFFISSGRLFLHQRHGDKNRKSKGIVSRKQTQLSNAV
jgi:hypothetical protein